MFLMETKNPDSFVIKKTEQLKYDNRYLVSPVGHGAGGLILLWKQEINLQILSASPNCIDTCVTYEGKVFYASFVYGDTNKPKRRELWDQLISLNYSRESPWFVTGDFNDLINNTEKEGGPERTEASFTDLRTFYSDGDLFDLPHTGDFLSWRGKREDYLVRCRLDRAAANSDWAELYPTACSQYLAYEGSDHRPLISVLEPNKKKKRGMFRYDRRLKDNPEAKELINRAWKTAVDKSVHGRIAIVRTALIEWSKQRFLNSRARIEEKKAELEKALTDPANDRELINTVTNELNAAYESEEEYWRQRS